MRIMWFSNAPWYPTGYGTQTKLFAPRLKETLGHEVAITAFAGLDGSILNIGGIPVYPRHDPRVYGQDVVQAHSEHFKADITLSLMDAWVCRPEIYGPNVHWVPWFPCDMDPMPEIVRQKVAQSTRPITMSKFGRREAERLGLDARYVPHGIDTSVFTPGDRADIRRRRKVPADAFVVGMVAANISMPSRKAFPQHLEAFAQFHKKHSDAILYLHTAQGTEGSAERVNLIELIRYLEIDKATYFTDQYSYTFGATPDTLLADAYGSMDVLMNVAMGEGFGIPILEAQACGTPVIVGDWTAMTELCFGGWLVDKSEALRFWTPLASYQWVPQPAAIADRLETAYSALQHRDIAKRKRDQAAAAAREYDADTITRDYWKPVLDEIAAHLGAEKGRTASRIVVPGRDGLNRQERRALQKVK